MSFFEEAQTVRGNGSTPTPTPHLPYLLLPLRPSHQPPPSGDYDNRTDCVLQNRTDQEPATVNGKKELTGRTDLHAMLRRAAEIQGRTMTDFVVSAVQDAARHAIEQAEVIRLSLADQACFVEALLSPPKPNAALKRAVARRRKLLSAK